MSDLLKDADTTGKIKALLAAKGLAYDSIATLLGITLPTVHSRFDKGNWDLVELRKIAEFYNVDPRDLL